MKGTIRVRVNKDGSKSYVCQVKLGRDPGTGKQRVLTGTAKSERAAHRLVHELLELTARLTAPEPVPATSQTVKRHLAFAGIGASTSGRSARDADDMLAEGFGRS